MEDWRAQITNALEAWVRSARRDLESQGGISSPELWELGEAQLLRSLGSLGESRKVRKCVWPWVHKILKNSVAFGIHLIILGVCLVVEFSF